MTTLAVAIESRGPVDPHPSLSHSLELWADYRAARGYSRHAVPLWTRPSSQPKAALNERYTLTLNLTAGSLDGLCVVDRDCRATCVTAESWRARSSSVVESRRIRASFLADHPAEFAAVLAWDAERVLRTYPDAQARPNCNSDLAWERVLPWLSDLLPIYDYTKRINRVGWVQPHYRTTYSATARTSRDTVHRIVGRGDTVTMVFPARKHSLPQEWDGIPVIDGDVHDDRLRDPAGVIVGLSWKGKLRGDYGSPLLSPVMAGC